MEGYEMMNKKIRKLAALCISAVTVLSLAGCGGGGHQAADVDPDTPVSEVTFPLKEQAELSFITSAPATSTQDPNERMIFKRLEKQTNVHIDWTCFVADQFADKKNLALAQFGNLPDGLFNAGMSDYDLLRYAKQGIIIPLEKLIDKYMPNLQAVFEKYPEYRTMCTAPDGHIYSFPWIEQLGEGFRVNKIFFHQFVEPFNSLFITFLNGCIDNFAFICHCKMICSISISFSKTVDQDSRMMPHGVLITCMQLIWMICRASMYIQMYL